MQARFSLDHVRVERKRLARPRTLSLSLPFPPSQTHLFLDGAPNERSMSLEYRNWRDEAQCALRSARARPMNGPVEITMTLEERGRLKSSQRELEKLARAPLALLVGAGLIDGDDGRTVRRLTLQWGRAAGLRVEISSLRLVPPRLPPPPAIASARTIAQSQFAERA